MRISVIGACLGFAWASVAPAGEGVIEINQAAALQGGVTPSDAPGYPVVLTQPGSYRLTSNLDAPIAAGAIVIASPFVTLDLGGFTVASTNVCTGFPTITSCTVTSTVLGIFGGEAMVSIRNGSVRGFGGTCVYLSGESAKIDGVNAFGCGQDGIGIESAGGRVTQSSAVQNRFRGILLGSAAMAEANEVRGNGTHGIFVSGSRGVARVVENRILENGGLGMTGNAAIQPVASRNFLASNAGGTFSLVVSLGDNLCLNAFC